MKQIIIAILLIGGIIGGAVVFGKDDNAVGGAPSNHIFGKADATVTLVEFGDFECPACAGYYPLIKEVKEKYKDQISFQFRHFPLVQTHQNALAAHRAAEAAGKQGKFYEMHDILYERLEEWNGPSGRDPVGTPTDQAIKLFEGYAESIGLDMEQYRRDVNDSSTVGTINADIAEGKSEFRVSGTPTFIFNGKVVEDLSTIDTIEELSALIEEALGIKTPTTDETNAAASETESTPATTPETAQ